MPDRPFADAIANIPKNELLIEAGAQQHGGAEVDVTLEREKTLKDGTLAAGVTGSVSTTKGAGVFGFIRRIWR
jgi:hypothetical protein